MVRSLSLPVHPPFDLTATVRLLQRRPAHPLDRLHEGAWWRLVEGERGPVLLRVRQERDRLRLDFPDEPPSRGETDWLAALVRTTVGLDVDLAPFRRAARRHPPLRPLVDWLVGMRPPRFPSLFEAILGVVPFQQLSLEAGMRIFSRLVERFGTARETPFGTFRAAPRPEAVLGASEAAIAALGTSRARARAIREGARAVADRIVDAAELERLPTSEARRRLLRLPGIGPWSANLILLRGLGRLDVFPPGDVGARRGIARLFAPEPVDVATLAETFAPQQGMLYFLALAAQLLERGLLDGPAA